MDVLKEIQKNIIKLENKVSELRTANRKWITKYQHAERKIVKLENEIANQSELEYLRTENSRLKVENNQLKKNEKALDKLKEIEKILKR